MLLPTTQILKIKNLTTPYTPFSHLQLINENKQIINNPHKQILQISNFSQYFINHIKNPSLI